MKKLALILALIVSVLPLAAAVPDVIPFQGRVSVGSNNFSGTGQFKFAIYQQPAGGGATTAMWNNTLGATSGAVAEPTTAAMLSVTNGLYVLALGDGVLSAALPATLQPAAGNKVWLRVWFNDGTNGFQALSPDVALNAVPFAREAAKADDAAKLNGQAAAFYLDRANHTGALPSGSFAGTYSGAVTLSNGSNAFTGSGAGLTALSATNLSTGTVADARLSANVALENAANTFSNAGNSFTGSGAGLTALSATNLATGTVADARLSGNVALRNAGNTFTGAIGYNGTDQTPFDLLSSNTGGTWMNFRNSSAGAHNFNLITTGSGNSEGAGKLLFRDATSSAIRMTLDSDGDVGIGTVTPGARLDVQVAAGQSLQFRQDSGLVPGINVNTIGGNAGIMRLRNALEIWPSDDATRAGQMSIRNAAGAQAILFDGATGYMGTAGEIAASGNISAIGQMYAGAGIIAPNLAAAKFARTVRDPRNAGDDLTVGSGTFANLDSISVNVPASGKLLFTVTVNVNMTNATLGGAPLPVYLKLEDTTSGGAVQLVEASAYAVNTNFSVAHGTVMTISWAENVAAGTRAYRSVITNSSGSSAAVNTTTLLVQFVPNSL